MSYEPKPSPPRHIHSPVDHYDVDAETGTVTYHVVRTNGDRIRSMSDEELAEKFNQVETIGRFNGPMGKVYWQEWLGKEVIE